MSLLEKINSPQDLKNFSVEELSILAADIRQEIIEVTSKNGGHLASNLATVELTICLHYLLTCPKDIILWDVGHQSYTHKLLTGRKIVFKKLRQLSGLSGFPNSEESHYDLFTVGHSGTAISQALGIIVADELQDRRAKVIAIVGDGSLTNGMAFEAMNNVGHLKKNLTVILNDNEMSISKTVGILSNYLNRVISSSTYNRMKENLSSLIKGIPCVGTKVLTLTERLDESLKNLLIPGIFFEQLGFRYFGPLEGHNIQGLLETLRNVFSIQEPTLIHIITKKGKGYEPAEQFPERFHSVPAFNIKTGEFANREFPTYTEIFGETLLELARQDKNIVAITAAMELGTGLDKFRKEFPKRFFDVGIAEQHAVTFAGGLAVQGIKPFVAIYSTFLQRAFDQVIHDIALQKLPIVFCLDRAGLVGDDGATHHGVFDLSYLNLIPGLLILIPANAEELAAMLEFAAKYKDGPIVIRYPRGCATYLDDKIKPIEIGKGVIVHEGKDIAIIGVGKAMEDAVIVYNELKDKLPDVDPYLINPRFLKPLDTSLVNDLKKKVHTIITIEDNALIGGFGSMIKSYFSNSDVKVYSFGIPDEFIEHGTVDQLKNMIGITPKKITKEIILILK